MENQKPASKGKFYFLAYSNDKKNFRDAAESYCRSAKEVGFDYTISYKAEDLQKTRFWRDNAEILEQPRGGGYWLWKPYIIRETLQKLGQHDVLFYNDAGRNKANTEEHFPSGFPATLATLVNVAPKGFIPGFRHKDWMNQARFTKIDCFALMGAMQGEMFSAPQVGASWSIWKPTEEAFKFLDEWLRYGTDARIITDETGFTKHAPHYDFDDHRHDQAIASILMHRHRSNYLDLSQKPVNGLIGRAREIVPYPYGFPKKCGNIDFALSKMVVPHIRNLGSELSDLDILLKEAKVIANMNGNEPIPQVNRYSLDAGDASGRNSPFVEPGRLTGDDVPEDIRKAARTPRDIKKMEWEDFIRLPFFSPFIPARFIPYAGRKKPEKQKGINDLLMKRFRTRLIDLSRGTAEKTPTDDGERALEAARHTIQEYFHLKTAKTYELELYLLRSCRIVLQPDAAKCLKATSPRMRSIVEIDCLRKNRKLLKTILAKRLTIHPEDKYFVALQKSVNTYYSNIDWSLLQAPHDSITQLNARKFGKALLDWKNGKSVRVFEESLGHLPNPE